MNTQSLLQKLAYVNPICFGHQKRIKARAQSEVSTHSIIYFFPRPLSGILLRTFDKKYRAKAHRCSYKKFK